MRLTAALLLLTLSSAAAVAMTAPELHAHGARQFQSSDNAGALKSLGAALKADPAFAPSRELRAMVHMSQKDWAAAVSDFSVLIATSPTPKHLMLRGACRAANGDLSGGLADAEAALALDPTYDPALALRTNLRKEIARAK